MGCMTFEKLGWRDKFQVKLNCRPERRWRKNFLTSLSRIFWGPKSSQNGEVWYGLDHYIVFHPSWCIKSGKSGGINSRDHFYRWDPAWQNEVWNLVGVFWGIKWHFLAVKLCLFSATRFILFYTQWPFQRCNNCVNESLYVNIMPLISWPSYLHHHGSKGCRVHLNYSWKRG